MLVSIDNNLGKATAAAPDALPENEEHLLRVIAEAIPGMLWICDSEGQCYHVSCRWREFTGTDVSCAMGEGGFSFIFDEDVKAVDEAWRRALRNGEIFQANARLRRHDGAIRWHRVRGVPELDARHTVKRWVVVWMDIEDQLIEPTESSLAAAKKQLEQTVSERTMQLREAEEELEAFAYSIAHDMRAPLRTMHMYAETVARDFGNRVPEEAHGYLNKIMGAAEKLDLLIRDVLIYTRVSQGRMKLQPVNLDLLLPEILIMQPQLNPPKVELHAQLPLHTVIGDETALTQVFTNLLTNAVKFMPEDRKPKVTVWTEEVGNNVRIYVKDNGIGIATTDLKRIFKMFERLQPDSKYQGAGIGLTIVRRAVERMGGALGVESVEGEGSTFWIELQKGERC